MTIRVRAAVVQSWRPVAAELRESGMMLSGFMQVGTADCERDMLKISFSAHPCNVRICDFASHSSAGSPSHLLRSCSGMFYLMMVCLILGAKRLPWALCIPGLIYNALNVPPHALGFIWGKVTPNSVSIYGFSSLNREYEMPL